MSESSLPGSICHEGASDAVFYSPESLLEFKTQEGKQRNCVISGINALSIRSVASRSFQLANRP